MGEVVNSRIRKKDKTMGDRRREGPPVQVCVVIVCLCVREMKKETDRQNCMS